MPETVVIGTDNVTPIRFQNEPLNGGDLVPGVFDEVTRLVFSLAGFRRNPIYTTELLDGQDLVDRSREPGWLDVRFGLMPGLPRGEFILRLEAFEGATDANPSMLLHETDPQQRILLRLVRSS